MSRVTLVLPAADAALELLCLLSPTPADYADLAADLHVETRDLRRLLGRLKATGIRVEQVTDRGGHVAARVSRIGWAEAERVATDYANQRELYA